MNLRLELTLLLGLEGAVVLRQARLALAVLKE